MSMFCWQSILYIFITWEPLKIRHLNGSFEIMHRQVSGKGIFSSLSSFLKSPNIGMRIFKSSGQTHSLTFAECALFN